MVDSKENYKFDHEPTILQSPWKRIAFFLLVILPLASFFSRLLSLVSWRPSWQFIVCFCFFFSNFRLRRRLFSRQWPGLLSCRTLDDWVPTRWRLLQRTEKWRIFAPLKLWGHCFCELRTKICCYVLVQNVQEIITSNKATRRYKIEVGETQSSSDSRRKRKWHFVVVQDENQRTHKTIRETRTKVEHSFEIEGSVTKTGTQQRYESAFSTQPAILWNTPLNMAF